MWRRIAAGAIDDRQGRCEQHVYPGGTDEDDVIRAESPPTRRIAAPPPLDPARPLEPRAR